MVKGLTAAQRLVEVLLSHHVSHVFCVPGESYIAVLDALGDVEDQIRVITCRHEAAAANMAVAYGKLTGRPGICFVTRGPGATHASIGVHTARHDSSPMILFVGQVKRKHRQLEAFQELDYVCVFGSMAKWVVEVDDAARVSELAERAFSIACHGRPGPVVMSLPEDMLTDISEDHWKSHPASVSTSIGPSVLRQIGNRLQQAERPLLILGGSGWTRQSSVQLARWCEANALPVCLSFRRKDIIDNDSPSYAGDLGLATNPQLIERVRNADLILAIGTRLSDLTTQGYTLLDPSTTSQSLIHIHPDADELGKVWPPFLAIAADSSSAVSQLTQLHLPRLGWSDWTRQARSEYEEFSKPVAVCGALNLSEIFHHLAQTLPAHAILCNGAGNYTVWLHRFYRHHQFATQLAPTSGIMGFGLPAAIAAKLLNPACEVFAIAGDGCFMMAASELATAIQFEAPIRVLIIDNGSLGTIRMHQERQYPNRPVATDLKNPDFVDLARSYGAWAKSVTSTEEFKQALVEARAHRGVSVLHLVTPLRDIAPGRALNI